VFRLTDQDKVYKILEKYRETIFDEETKIILDGINISLESGIAKIKAGYFGTECCKRSVEYFLDFFPHPIIMPDLYNYC
jgi:hypothetical protein